MHSPLEGCDPFLQPARIEEERREIPDDPAWGQTATLADLDHRDALESAAATDPREVAAAALAALFPDEEIDHKFFAGKMVAGFFGADLSAASFIAQSFGFKLVEAGRNASANWHTLRSIAERLFAASDPTRAADALGEFEAAVRRAISAERAERRQDESEIISASARHG